MQRLEERAQKAGNPEAITEEQLEQHAALLVATEYDPGPEEPTSQRRRVGMLNLEPRFRGQQRAAAGGQRSVYEAAPLIMEGATAPEGMGDETQYPLLLATLEEIESGPTDAATPYDTQSTMALYFGWYANLTIGQVVALLHPRLQYIHERALI